MDKSVGLTYATGQAAKREFCRELLTYILFGVINLRLIVGSLGRRTRDMAFAVTWIGRVIPAEE